MILILACLLAVLPPPAERVEQLTLVQMQTEQWLSESLEADVVWLEFKIGTVHGHIEKEGESKFIKIHKTGMGTLELERSKNLQTYFPTIVGERVIQIPPFECLIQPYVKSVDKPGGMLYDMYYLFPDQVIPLLSKTIGSVKQVVFKTLENKVSSAGNDRFYFDRLRTQKEDGISGSVEIFYTNKSLIGVPWEVLLKKKFKINDVTYHVTIQELLQRARIALNPKQLRPLATCHGDWTDMNVCVIDGAPYFLDCETSGDNDPIGDAIVFLVYNAIHGDYLGPKYFKHHFHGRDKAIQAINFAREPLTWNMKRRTVNIKGYEHFGTSVSRKEAIKHFIDSYFNPLLNEIQRKGISEQEIEEKIRAALLARLLAVYDLTIFTPEDQARILALLVQTLCQNKEPALTVFERLL